MLYIFYFAADTFFALYSSFVISRRAGQPEIPTWTKYSGLCKKQILRLTMCDNSGGEFKTHYYFRIYTPRSIELGGFY